MKELDKNMTPSQVAREIIEKLIEYDQWRDSLHINDFPVTRANIEKALTQAISEEREAIIKAINNLDPLKAICDWDNGDDIAIAVRDYILSAIRKQGEIGDE